MIRYVPIRERDDRSISDQLHIPWLDLGDNFLALILSRTLPPNSVVAQQDTAASSAEIISRVQIVRAIVSGPEWEGRTSG
jgi:hypothetical protein